MVAAGFTGGQAEELRRVKIVSTSADLDVRLHEILRPEQLGAWTFSVADLADVGVFVTEVP